MIFFPFENITYETKVDSEIIRSKINGIIEPEKNFRFTSAFGAKEHKPYQGSIDGNSFKMTRIIGYKNSFLPRIEGSIERNFESTKINVKMRLNPLVIVFMLFWCGMIGSIVLEILSASIEKGRFNPIIIPPLLGMIFGYVLMTGGFKYESIKSKNYLNQLFDSGIKQNE